MKFPQKTVPEHVARNPIARQMAWLKVKSFVTLARNQVYLMNEDVEYRNFVVAISEYLALVYVGAEYDKILAHENIAEPIDKISQASVLLTTCGADGFLWKKEYAAILDDALYCAQEITKLLTPHAINYAWLKIHTLDGEAAPAKPKLSTRKKKK